MKIRKNSLLLIMILTVIWLGVTGVSASTLLPTDVENPSSGCTLLGVKGEYITEIPQALKRINEIRKEACQEGVQDPNTGAPLNLQIIFRSDGPLTWNTLQGSVRQNPELQWHTKEQMERIAFRL